MANLKFELIDGLKVDETIHKDIELRELTAGDLFAAENESEELRIIGKEAILVQSPSKYEACLLRRQVAKLGSRPMPLAEGEFNSLSRQDLMIIQKYAREMDKEVYENVKNFEEKISQRGRTSEGASQPLSPD